jgi:hypothetical protein
MEPRQGRYINRLFPFIKRTVPVSNGVLNCHGLFLKPTETLIDPLVSEQLKLQSEASHATNVLARRIAGLPEGPKNKIYLAEKGIEIALEQRSESVNLAMKRAEDNDYNLVLFEWMVFIGTGLYAKRQRDQLKPVMSQYGIEDVFGATRKILDFRHTPEIVMRLDNYSLGQLYDEDGEKREIDLVNRFKFLISAMNGDSPKPSRGNLIDRYPEIVKNQKVGLTEAVSKLVEIASFSNSPANFFSRYLREIPNSDDYFEFSQTLIERLQQTRGLLVDAIFNPSLPEHATIRNTIQRYLLRKDPSSAYYAFSLLTLYDPDDSWVRKLFQSAKSRSKFGKDRHFYFLFANLLSDYARQNYDICSLDNAMEIVTGSVSTVSIEDLSGLREAIHHIGNKTRKTEYEIGPEAFEKCQISKPISVHVSLNKDRPTKFAMEAVFKSNHDEGHIKVRAKIDADTKNENIQIEGNFLEAPDATQMTKLRAGIILIARRALNEIGERVDQEWNEKQKAKKPVVIFQPKANEQVKRGTCRPEPEQEVASKKRVKNGKTGLIGDDTPDNHTSDKSSSTGEDVECNRKIPWQIVLPKDEAAFRELFKGMDPKDVEYVRHGVERANEYHVGNFKKIVGIGKKRRGEEERFRLKVGEKGRRYVMKLALRGIQDDSEHKHSVLIPLGSVEPRNDDYKGNFAKT